MKPIMQNVFGSGDTVWVRQENGDTKEYHVAPTLEEYRDWWKRGYFEEQRRLRANSRLSRSIRAFLAEWRKAIPKSGGPA